MFDKNKAFINNNSYNMIGMKNLSDKKIVS